MSSSLLVRSLPIHQSGSPKSKAIGPIRAHLFPTADLWILIALFLAGLFPFAATSVLMYPDEPQYLDAGVFMCQSGDWLMPSDPNDAPPQDIKPILTYWIVAACYKLFGTHVWAARLPYLLAGAGVIYLTYRLTMMLTAIRAGRGSRIAAALAVTLLIPNPILWISAIRCIPDIWLCFFLLMSAHGFIALLIMNKPTSRDALLAYVGVGLAFLTKGIPAL